jgi:chemotaxis protein CheZ
MARQLVGEAMAGPRKIFRIEESAAMRLTQSIENTQAALRHAEIMQALAALRAEVAAGPRQPDRADGRLNAETERLAGELNLIHDAISGTAPAHRNGAREPAADLTRIGHELNAVVNGAEHATQRILAIAEEIDEAANNLSAALTGRIEQDLVQDVQDLVIRIFEACNFQDLIGQRVAKVLVTLKFVEDHIARVLDENTHITSPPTAADSAQVLHGPRLDSDRGHVSQRDIDAMFGEKEV